MSEQVKSKLGWIVAATSIGINIGGLAGTYTVLNNTQAAQAVQINDHEARIRAQGVLVVEVANDVKWIRQSIERKGG